MSAQHHASSQRIDEVLTPSAIRKDLSEYISRPQGMLILGTASKTLFDQIVVTCAVRHRRLPGACRTRYHRADIEKIAREAVQGGSPQQTA